MDSTWAMTKPVAVRFHAIKWVAIETTGACDIMSVCNKYDQSVYFSKMLL